MAAQVKLTLATTAQLHNGSIGIAFADIVKTLGKDCEDRPGLDKDRQIAMVLRLRPRTDKKGNLDDVAVDVEFQSKIPAQRSNRYVMKVKADGSVYFHPDDRNDPDAEHLFDGEQPDDKKKGKGKDK